MNTPLQQAVKNLIDRWNSPIDWPEHLALRKALDAELQQSVEPVLWITDLDDPIICKTEFETATFCEDGQRPIPVYLHPPQQVAVAPANNNWLIRKEPNTKDSYYVAEGNPPNHVLEIYGITAQGEKP